MSEPSGPSRRSDRSRPVLGLGLAAAVLTAGLWLFLARGDGRVAYLAAPAAEPARIGDTTWQLNQLRVLDAVPVYGDQREAVRGAQFVVAELRADLTGLGVERGCALTLVAAGGYQFDTEPGYSPDGVATGCTPGTNGPVSVAFEVPQRLVGEVRGVAVSMLDGAPATLLSPTP